MRVRVLHMPNYEDKEDVEYFKRKMADALKIPLTEPKKTPLLDFTEQVWSDDEEA